MSVVGIGNGVKLEELDRLALEGQGNRRLLGAPDEAPSLVDRELYAVSNVVARAVRLRIRLSPGVRLVDVVGSYRLDEVRAQRVREAEQSIDRRMARNLGIQADRGEDEEGIQIVIPTYYAGDAHVILLDVLAPGAGSVADVTVRYKDLVWLRNGVARANLSVGSSMAAPGPLERNVLKNLVAYTIAGEIKAAGQRLAGGRLDEAIAIVARARALLEGLAIEVAGWADDAELATDIHMLAQYRKILGSLAATDTEGSLYVADSLKYAAFTKLVPPVQE